MRTLLVLVPLLCSGCYTVRFYDGALKDAGAERGRAYDLWVQSFFWGLIPAGKVDTSMCREGVRNAKSQIGGLGLLAYWLTLGIWTPMHVHIVCADPVAGPEERGTPFVIGDETHPSPAPAPSPEPAPSPASPPAPAPAPPSPE